MRAARTPKALGLTFNTLESRLLRHILKQIITNYQITPQDLNPKAASVWYSAKGCESARMSPEETQEWLEHLHQYKSAHVQNLTKWRRRLALPKEGHCRLNVKLEEVPVLLSALNDHRLFLAASHDLGQKEMDARSVADFANLQPAQQMAVSEIHVLGCIIEEILRFLPGNPADWMESL